MSFCDSVVQHILFLLYFENNRQNLVRCGIHIRSIGESGGLVVERQSLERFFVHTTMALGYVTQMD